jgi:hypothetical protein
VKPLRALLIAAGLAALLYPLGIRQLARRRALARVARLARNPGACSAPDADALSLRLARLGPLLASWETIGGCGAGGGTAGTGIKWIGRQTTGGFFQVQTLNSFTTILPTGPTGAAMGGYNFISNNQITHDFTDKWSGGVSIPYAWKWYPSPFGNGPLWNAGLGDMNVLATRKLGEDNSWSLTGLVFLPTGTYKATYGGSLLPPDEQLGFGEVTGSMFLDKNFDQDWGLITVGGAANYRGGTNKIHYTRYPSATAYAYTGYAAGPFYPSAGINILAQQRQDTRGDFGENVNTPVLQAAGQASLEWSNPYVAVLGGVFLPFSALQPDWQTYGHFKLQSWMVALNISVSPF